MWHEKGPDTLLPTCARPSSAAAAPTLVIASIVLLLLGTKQAVLGDHCCVILGFFIEFKLLVFLCEKCSVKVQCQTLKMVHVPHWFDHSVHFTPVFDSTVTCCVLPRSPSLLSCATWMLFWECIRFRLKKKPYPMFFCLMQRLEDMQQMIGRRVSILMSLKVNYILVCFGTYVFQDQSSNVKDFWLIVVIII